MPASTIDVVVPTFNGWEMTESCLRHLEAQTIPHTVIVADNGSADGTPERLHAAFTDVRVCALGENRGFAAACNAGARGLVLTATNAPGSAPARAYASGSNPAEATTADGLLPAGPAAPSRLRRAAPTTGGPPID